MTIEARAATPAAALLASAQPRERGIAEQLSNVLQRGGVWIMNHIEFSVHDSSLLNTAATAFVIFNQLTSPAIGTDKYFQDLLAALNPPPPPAETTNGITTANDAQPYHRYQVFMPIVERTPENIIKQALTDDSLVIALTQAFPDYVKLTTTVSDVSGQVETIYGQLAVGPISSDAFTTVNEKGIRVWSNAPNLQETLFLRHKENEIIGTPRKFGNYLAFSLFGRYPTRDLGNGIDTYRNFTDGPVKPANKIEMQFLLDLEKLLSSDEVLYLDQLFNSQVNIQAEKLGFSTVLLNLQGEFMYALTNSYPVVTTNDKRTGEAAVLLGTPDGWVIADPDPADPRSHLLDKKYKTAGRIGWSNDPEGSRLAFFTPDGKVIIFERTPGSRWVDGETSFKIKEIRVPPWMGMPRFLWEGRSLVAILQNGATYKLTINPDGSSSWDFRCPSITNSDDQATVSATAASEQLILWLSQSLTKSGSIFSISSQRSRDCYVVQLEDGLIGAVVYPGIPPGATNLRPLNR